VDSAVILYPAFSVGYFSDELVGKEGGLR
jgi:hypothetical protein